MSINLQEFIFEVKVLMVLPYLKNDLNKITNNEFRKKGNLAWPFIFHYKSNVKSWFDSRVPEVPPKSQFFFIIDLKTNSKSYYILLHYLCAKIYPGRETALDSKKYLNRNGLQTALLRLLPSWSPFQSICRKPHQVIYKCVSPRAIGKQLLSGKSRLTED